LFMAACSKDKDIDTPAVLSPFHETLKVERVWTASVPDKGAKSLRLGLGPAVEGNRVYVAGYKKGEVVAYDLNSGRTVWRTKTKAPLSGGPAASADLIVVGSSVGDVIALERADGKVRWRARLNGEILAAPAISDRAVAVRTVDGKLRALSPKDGHELWTQEQQVPRLSLRGTSRPVIVGELTLCGFDNGKVIAVNMNDGSLQWEATVAPPHGRTELERLVDVDSTPRVSGQDVFTVGFQGRVAMLALATGQVWWSHDASSYRGMGIDDDALYVASADGSVVALRRRTGAEIWRQKALLHRGLSGVAVTDNAVVTADYKGFVHWLDKATGELAGRVKTGKVRISNPPVVAGNMVLVVNDVGKIFAFRTSPIGATMAGPRTVPGEDSASKAAAPTSPSEPGAGATVTPPQ
ncbi:MAG TPA: outer membrane protein assembly factor BamB, partial [Steroidobacteraceae bacterium]|nr:outer membrane protein assembly factor BamB [Steroidobacteraceae bacterium]